MPEQKAIPQFIDPKEITGRFIEPLPGKPRVSSGYPFRNDGKTPHSGVDYAVVTNTPVYSAADGEVVRADRTDDKGYGNQVRVWHPSFNITTVYAHLNRIITKVGQQVKIGQILGLSGGNPNDDIPGDGSSQGAHLHFELQVGRSPHGGGRSVPPAVTADPLATIAKWKTA